MYYMANRNDVVGIEIIAKVRKKEDKFWTEDLKTDAQELN